MTNPVQRRSLFLRAIERARQKTMLASHPRARSAEVIRAHAGRVSKKTMKSIVNAKSKKYPACSQAEASTKRLLRRCAKALEVISFLSIVCGMWASDDFWIVALLTVAVAAFIGAFAFRWRLDIMEGA